MDTGTFSAFHFRLYWLFCCLGFTRRGWPYITLSRQNNPTFGIGLHEVYVRTGGRASQAGREKNEGPSFFSLPAACRLLSRGVIFTRARVSLAPLSLRKNGGLLVVYGQVYTVITKFSCFHRFPIHLSNGAPQHVRAWKFRCYSEVPNNFILLKTSVSLSIVPSACWAWRRQLEKEQEVWN